MARVSVLYDLLNQRALDARLVASTVAETELAHEHQATVLLSNVESVVVGPAHAQLSARTAGRAQPAQVNRAVSPHALKSRLIALLPLPAPRPQTRVLTMPSLFQRQWGWGEVSRFPFGGAVAEGRAEGVVR